MIVNNIGLTEDSYSHIYTADGSEIGTVYDSEGRIVYYMYRDTIGDGSRVFTSYGAPIKDYKIYGNTMQDGTPSPDMPVDVVGCGEWDSAANSYKLPVTVTNGTDTVATHIYIGSEPLHRIGNYADCVDYSSGKIVRQIKKLVLTGNENISTYSGSFIGAAAYDARRQNNVINIICSHYLGVPTASAGNIGAYNLSVNFSITTRGILITDRLYYPNIADFKAYLAAQYAAGTPVAVWYVLETPIEEDPPITLPAIPTLPGTNTLAIDTTVKPSEVDLTGRLKTSGYGQLLDKNLAAINDSTGTPIFIRG